MSILIVGSGPVGTSLAIALIQKGIAVKLFESGTTLSNEIRASTFHPPTLELFKKWGTLDDVMSNGHAVSSLQFWDRQQKKIIAEFDYKAIKNDTQFPFRLQCPQHIYTRTIFPILQQSMLCEIYMGHKLIDMEQSSDGITAKFRDDKGNLTEHTGIFLCGADGANSTARQLCKFDFPGMTYEDRFLLVATQWDLSTTFPDIAPVNYMFDSQEWVIVLHLKNLVRIVFRLRDDEDIDAAMAEDAVQRRLANFIGENNQTIPISSVSNYRVHQRVSDNFRQGRCLLLGDAAHINNPASGMGMNSGIHDAYHLAEAIEQHQNGNHDALENYAVNRRQHALNTIRAYSDKRYRDLNMKDPEAIKKRNARYQKMASRQDTAREFLLKASMLEDRIHAN